MIFIIVCISWNNKKKNLFTNKVVSTEWKGAFGFVLYNTTTGNTPTQWLNYSCKRSVNARDERNGTWDVKFTELLVLLSDVETVIFMVKLNTAFARVICALFLFWPLKIGVRKICGFFLWESWSGFYSSIFENTVLLSIFYCNFVT
jgi:hypothetical protein